MHHAASRSILTAALAAALATAGASCASRAPLPAVDPVVRDQLLDCASQQAAGYGFVIFRSELDVPGRVELVRAAQVTGTSVSYDALVFVVERSDSTSQPDLRFRAFAAIRFSSFGAGSQELAPRPEVVEIGANIRAHCKGGPARTPHPQRIN